MKTFFSFSAAAILAGSAFSVHGQSLRCQGDLARVGDSKASIVQKCGEPQHKDAFCKPVEATTVKRASTVVLPCERIEAWTYNPGRGQFLTTLHFHAGKVTAIEYGDRVQ